MPTDRPIIYLTNWSSTRSPGFYGPGRKLTIMAAPRFWERGDGRVPVLLPELEDLREARSGRLPIDAYRARYTAQLERNLAMGSLVPGFLFATAVGGAMVRDGDTLCCSCSRDAAARGECHRAWAAPFLVRAGWRVILDGRDVTDE